MDPTAEKPITNFSQKEVLIISVVPNAPINRRNKLRNTLERYFLREVSQNSFTITKLSINNNILDVNTYLNNTGPPRIPGTQYLIQDKLSCPLKERLISGVRYSLLT